MDGPGFDAWTRRHFGIVAGGLIATGISIVGLPLAEAKKKHRKKKRCQAPLASCQSSGKRKCCGDLRCSRAFGNAGLLCCKTEGTSCRFNSTLQIDECCDGLFCRFTEGPVGDCVPITSDRALKSNFGSVDPVDMLARVRDLPISTWDYTSAGLPVRHVGPMAQDFAAIFGVGADDRGIHPIDGQGVALAAIQGFSTELERTRSVNAALAVRIAALEADQV